MKLKIVILLLLFSFGSCKDKEEVTSLEEEVVPVEQTEQVSEKEAEEKVGIVLTSNALQLIDLETGSTTELAFGMEKERLTDIMYKVLDSEIIQSGVNTECGAGPLLMVSYENGLVLVFQNESAVETEDWKFAGWFLQKKSGNTEELTTMAGIGIGSTRAEMEEAYVLEVNETSLGHEFSTSAGLYGIFTGPEADAEIEMMWSGLSCNFR